MRFLRKFLPTLAATVALFALTLAAQTETYKTRLSAVPADTKSRPEITGLGSATAVLSGTKLTVNATFEGLRTPATFARLHAAVMAGVRGPAIGDLTVTKATSGTVTGSIDLTPAQLQSLRKGGVYLEIFSEKAPEGNLWGWLLR
jgi:hypothetical protein